MPPDVDPRLVAVEAMRDAMQSVAADFAEQMIKEKLDDWAARYPRHTFSGGIGHGMVVLHVDPPVGRRKDIAWLDQRHAISHEAEALVDLILTLDDCARSGGTNDTPFYTTSNI